MPLTDWNERRAAARGNGRYLLAVDLAEFYRSVYSHSIPWALHTKAVAKASRGQRRLPGEQLDTALRRVQRDETMGLPVGPDVSFVIGEVLLSAIDHEISKRASPIAGIRYYDDYELTFSNRSDAEQALAVVQETLGKYNLLANPTKTRVVALPERIDSRWAAAISGMDLTPGRGMSARLVRFFDAVVEHRGGNPDAQVVGYAIARFDDQHLISTFSASDWKLTQSIFCHLVVNEPSAIVQLIKLLGDVELNRNTHLRTVDRPQLSRTLNEIIRFSAPLGHSSEVSWALWGLIAFGLVLDQAGADAISGMTDSVVALLALDLKSRGLIPTGLDVSQWTPLISAGNLYEEQWLLAYEAPMHGWLGTDAHIQADQNFRVFHSAGARFYKRFRRLTPRVVRELGLWSTGYDNESGFRFPFIEEEDDDDDAEQEGPVGGGEQSPV